jgi:hypothetical protein
MRDHQFEACRLFGKLIESGTQAIDALAQFLDLALGGENAAGLRLLAASHHVAPAKDVAVERDDRERHQRRNAGGRVEWFGDERAAEHGLNSAGKRSTDSNNALQRNRTRRDIVVHRHPRFRDGGTPNDESAPAGIFLSDQLQAGWHVVEPFDQYVLQQIAKAGFHRALVARLNLDEVGQRTHLTHFAVGAHQHEPGGVGETWTMGVDLFQRA